MVRRTTSTTKPAAHTGAPHAHAPFVLFRPVARRFPPLEPRAYAVPPGLLKASDNDPDRLTAIIMQSVRDGFAEAVMPAANRLTVIGKDNIERALTVLAVVQRDCDELELAEGTLNELLQRKPGSPAAYVGLGMLQERQGNLDASVELLWQALEKDCNHPDAVHGYLQVRHRQVGDDGYPAEIEKVMALPGAWRAQMWDAGEAHAPAVRTLCTLPPPGGWVLAGVFADELFGVWHGEAKALMLVTRALFVGLTPVKMSTLCRLLACHGSVALRQLFHCALPDRNQRDAPHRNQRYALAGGVSSAPYMSACPRGSSISMRRKWSRFSSA